MTKNALVPWKADIQAKALDTISDPSAITSRALQLRDRERNQILVNLEAGNFEVASSYVWTRAMTLLKRQLGSLGAEFIGELLKKPDIDDLSDIATSISDSEAISLALDLGVISPLQSKRLFQSQEIVTYFSALSSDLGGHDDEVMTKEEAISCLRVCVQSVLGQESLGAAEDFKKFRQSLSTETFAEDNPNLQRLIGSPYFFVRTAISVLLSLFKSTKGAQLEHAGRNAQLIIPLLWPRLKEPERWQIGQAYAEEYNEGRKDVLKSIHTVLLRVSGFDYVPESLRSSTFVKVANSVIDAHQARDNFYNEPAPMKELANLGTSIPGPALAVCLTAALCVKLGNRWGRSIAAQPSADQLLNGISKERWLHYLDGRLEEDRLILFKLDEEKPQKYWVDLINSLDISPSDIQSPRVKKLILATLDRNSRKIDEIAVQMYTSSLGL